MADGLFAYRVMALANPLHTAELADVDLRTDLQELGIVHTIDFVASAQRVGASLFRVLIRSIAKFVTTVSVTTTGTVGSFPVLETPVV